jgi:TRAP-type C4-dicarboxylate transport system substrate-binding protein
VCGPTRWLAVALACTIIAAACSGTTADPANRGDKAGGPVPPTRLRLGTPDESTQPGADAILEFSRQVEELSDGQLLIDPVWKAQGGEVRGWDQNVAVMVAKRELDMAMVPARAWDVLGVSSLNALHAPMLVDSEELVKQIVSGEMASEMLAGLDAAGVVGLALLPESLRHPFGFGEPLLSVEDFVGKAYRAARSDAVYATLRALGARPDDPTGEEYTDGVADGSIEAVDADFVWAAWLPRRAVATGNVTLYPKLQALVINEDTFAALAGPERDVLRRAAAGTREWVSANFPTDAEAARRFCADGGAIAFASASDLAAIEDALQPVHAQLAGDPASRSLLERIGALKEELGPPSETVEACSPAD